MAASPPLILGPAAAIDDQIKEALETTKAGQIDAAPFWRRVNEKVFPPALLSRLSTHQRWFLSPDGELNRIPFAALPSPSSPDQRLVESVELRLITSGRDLVPAEQGAARQTTQPPLVLADPDFGPAQSENDWRRLPRTAEEGQEISKQIGAVLFQRAQATTDRCAGGGPRPEGAACGQPWLLLRSPGHRQHT